MIYFIPSIFCRLPPLPKTPTLLGFPEVMFRAFIHPVLVIAVLGSW